MNRNRLPILNIVLLLGLSTAPGCGLTPKTDWRSSRPEQTGIQQQAPLEQLSPKLAADACLATASQLEEKGRFRDAIAQYNRARSHQPQRPGIAHRLAVLHDRMENTQAALREYEIALQETPVDPELLNDLGYFHFQRQQFPEAEAYYNKSVEQKPTHSRAWTNLGLTLGAQKRYKEAEAAFQKAGSQAFAKHNLGIVLAQQGEFAKARALFLEARQLDPMLKQPDAVLNWLNEHPETNGTARVSQN